MAKHSLRARHVWFLKWETFPSVRIFISLLLRLTQNEKKEIGDVKTYGMFDKIHFGPVFYSPAKLNGWRGVFITGPPQPGLDLLQPMKWNKVLRQIKPCRLRRYSETNRISSRKTPAALFLNNAAKKENPTEISRQFLRLNC